jgi:hypothetical protein
MVVLHTGETPWRRSLRLVDLMRPEPGSEVYIPEYRVHLLDLPAETPDALTAGDDPTGWLLRALQEERAVTADFADAVAQAEARLDQLPPSDEALWERGTQYLLMLVYYRRAQGEQQGLWQRVQEAVVTPSRRVEVTHMIRSYAEDLLDQGRSEGERAATRRSILALVEERFGAVPAQFDERVRSLDDVAQLDRLLRQVARAERLEDVDLGQA